jgi:peptide-methionine (R)-S-oxide reductase
MMRGCTLAAALILSACSNDAREAETARVKLPPPANGPAVTLMDFSPAGVALGRIMVPKIVLTEEEWRARLTPLQFSITRRKGTEFAFTGKLNKHQASGLYRCAGCNNVLFRSEEKYDSHTGWPSFSAPAALENIYTKMDRSLGIEREEVLCRRCDAHLGHVFPDGPEPAGMRFCMNSAALVFEGRAGRE